MDPKKNEGRQWLKAELHSHCSLDPVDYRICSHTPEELIEKAAELRFDVLAITCHDRDIWSHHLSEYAESLGVVLIPAMEVTTGRTRHTLVYNFQTGSENLNTLEKIRARRRKDTLVIAAHPYFPTNRCLRELLEPNIEIFDAIESSGFYLRSLDFNKRARHVARKYGKPLVGNGDVHHLWQMGRTFTWIYATHEMASVLDAVKAGKVHLETQPLTPVEIARWWGTTIWRHLFPVNIAPRHRDEVPAGSRL